MALRLEGKHAWVLAWSLAAAGVAAVACVQTVMSLPSPPGTASEVVGPGGATLVTNDTLLVVPPKALDASVNVTIAPNATPPPLTQAVAITPAHTFGPEGQTFGIPVCITLSFEPAQLPPGMTGQNVFLYSAPQDSGDYQVVPSLAVDSTHVMGMTTHFSNVFVAYADGGPELPLDAGCETPDAEEDGEAGGEAGEAGASGEGGTEE